MEAKHFQKQVQPLEQGQSTSTPDFRVRRWSMGSDNRILYQNDHFHTLSFYLKGGHNNIRLDRPDLKGEQGRFCLMPQAQDSVWQINERVEFAHVYFSDAWFKRFAASTFDMDTRFVDIGDRLFVQDATLQSLFLRCFVTPAYATRAYDMQIEQAILEVMHYLLSQRNTNVTLRLAAKGGLSPGHRKSVKHLIEERLEEKLTLEQLASEVNLSPFHFARMFKLSFGESPARFVTWRRVEKTKVLLKTSMSLAQISQSLGFANQSHMTQCFRQATGVTPARYRLAVQ